MSRYAPSDYRPARDRSRSPARFPDRRTSVASTGYASRASDLSRGGADAPRGPRSQFDGGRPPLSSGLPGPGPSRGGYAGRGEIRELRDAPPLGSDRGRAFKDRDFDRRERVLSPRGRSPPRNYRETRDYPPPRELDIPRARRGSRDGPPSAGSAYSDAPAPFATAPPFRGGFSRGRGRGDFEFRGGRGGRRNLDDRDLFRRERSPPVSRWPPRDTRDISREPRDTREPREPREAERRDERRFERRDEERRPEWTDRERDVDRLRRDPPQPRLENRASNDSLASGASHPPPAPHVNPDRLALLESVGADTSVRRPSLTPSSSSAREHRREQPEIPAYLNGRAETTNNRYGSRGSSPPTQAPPVPAFTLSFAPSAQGGASNASRPPQEPKNVHSSPEVPHQEAPKPINQDKPAFPPDAPTAPKAAPHAPKPQAPEPPPAAPKAPRALGTDGDSATAPTHRLHGARSWESNLGHDAHGRADTVVSQPGQQPAVPLSPNVGYVRANQPPSPAMQHGNRASDLSAPTGPKASRPFSAHTAAPPRLPFASPQADQFTGSGPAFSRPKTPPPSAPSGPRNRAFSVSPKVSSTSIPTAPKANRAPPIAPRALDRGPAPLARMPERGNAMQPRVPPTAPRAAQWNQWRRPGVPALGERSIPAKRDASGEEKRRASVATMNGEHSQESQHAVKVEPNETNKPAENTDLQSGGDRMDVDEEATIKKPRSSAGHSAQQSFFGKPLEKSADDSGMSDAPEEAVSSSEDDDLEIEDPALFEAKFERQKRELESQLVDLSSKNVRATTPLESIARLARVSTKDLERFRERDQEMDIDEPRDAAHDKQPPSDESEESIVTPRNEDAAAPVAIQDGEGDGPATQTLRRPSPEPVNLPYLLKDSSSTYQDSWEFRDALQRQDDTKESVISALKDEVARVQDGEEDMEAIFAEHYIRWKDECASLDREREAEDRLERQQSDEPGPEADASPNALAPSSTAEGRRALKFSSDYEFQQVLKQSEETARLEREKQDVELKKWQADMEKEAVLPDQMTAKEFQRSCFIDNNRLCDPRSLTRIFTYQPPVDNFTEHEQQIFIAAYKETPKKWTEIATLLPGRAAKDCIRHYYANKWDGRFKDNRRRKGGGRRGRGTKGAPRGKGSAAMADLGRAEDIIQSVSDSGRPKRAAAPTTFGEREMDAKNAMQAQSPARRPGASKQDGEPVPEKQAKRRKGMGEKPGRKPKASQQPLAQIAAAPSMSPNARFIPSLPSKDDPAMIQSLAEASLLTGFHTSNRSMPPEAPHPVYIQENYPQPIPVQEELERKHAAAAPTTTKPSASSYWSVPEQSDFVKYIAHFGTDFAAIAAHMGTKTQTMIKNHYQRQIDGGNRADLEESAVVANTRRERGEDMGAPPTPTPINKRKYDNPGPAVPRSIAPHGDAMDIDDAPSVTQSQALKHPSPPQFHVQSRFPSSAQATPVQAPRVAPSPVPTPTSAVTPLSQAVASARNMQQQQQREREQQQQQQREQQQQQQREQQQQQQQPPQPQPQPQQTIGSRMSIFGDSRPESRPGLPASTSFRTSQQGTPTGQLAQPSRTVPDAHDSNFIRNLKEEQERAIRMQGQYAQQERQERMDPFQHRGSLHQTPLHQSPLNQPLSMPQERKPMSETRPASPRGFFQSADPTRRGMDSPAFNNLAPATVSSLANRMPFNPSPTKREEPPRSSSVFSAPPAPPPPAPAAVAEAPKRSNLLSILNNEPDEPKPPAKRVSDQAMASSMPQRVASPAQHPLAAPSAISAMPAPRRETFGQSTPAPSSQPQMQRGPFGQPTTGPSPTAVKQEPHAPSGQSLHQQPPPRQDWATRIIGQGSEPAQNSGSPALEREVRPYFSHHRASALGPTNGPQRHNPSPPPHSLMGHSRTPSLSGQGPSQPPREQRGFLQNQQHAPHQVGTPSAQPLQPTSFQPPPPPPFSQAPPTQAQNQAHHAHNSSIGGPFNSLHQRNLSREDSMRQEQAFVAQRQAQEQAQAQAQAQAHQRDHEWRRMNDERRMDDERRMREEQRLHEERRMHEERIMQEQRRMHEERDSEGRRREAAYMAAQEERYRHQQQNFGVPRGGPPQHQMHPTHFAGAGGFDQGPPRAMGMGGIREQSMRDAQDVMLEQERMRRDAEMREEHRRRQHEDTMYTGRRPTPLGMSGFGGPPPGAPPPGPARR